MESPRITFQPTGGDGNPPSPPLAVPPPFSPKKKYRGKTSVKQLAQLKRINAKRKKKAKDKRYILRKKKKHKPNCKCGPKATRCRAQRISGKYRRKAGTTGLRAYKVKRFYERGLSLAEIAKRFGVSRQYIHAFMIKHGIERRKPGEWVLKKRTLEVLSPRRFENALSDLVKGDAITRVIKRYHISPYKLYEVAQQLGWSPKKKRPCGQGVVRRGAKHWAECDACRTAWADRIRLARQQKKFEKERRRHAKLLKAGPATVEPGYVGFPDPTAPSQPPPGDDETGRGNAEEQP